MIKINRIKCKRCGDVVESKSVHDMVWCSCGQCAADGGLKYIKRCFRTEKPEDAFIELSAYTDAEGGGVSK